jgi:SAM-dependent methyltransferase
MDSEDLLKTRYDETPYRDQIFEDLDLSRLLGLAKLFALGPRDPKADDLRVLDLCCASGWHIRQQAARYPHVQFTGVDFSRAEIEAGNKAIAEDGATNVELIPADLREFEIRAGDYDLILCHGAFSWVPDEVKDRIFELCRMGLKRSGVAAIAYLTYPGWKQREALRELLAFRTAGIDEPQERIQQSALLLRLLHAGYSTQEESCHAQSLKEVVESMQRSSANVFLHDDLGGIHDPCYFIQFVEWASEWGMQYLSEVDLATMALAGLPPEAMEILQRLAPDFLETQQLIDFLVNRSGRMSLIVRDDAPIARELGVDRLRGLQFTTSLLYRGAPDPPPTEPQQFETLLGKTLELEDPCELALLHRMLDTTTHAPTLADLETGATEGNHSAPDVAQTLLSLIARGFAEPRLSMD